MSTTGGAAHRASPERSTVGSRVPLTPEAAHVLEPRGRLEPGRPATAGKGVILVVEDSPEDRELIEWAFEECRDQVSLRSVCDGREALDYLFQEGPHRDPARCPRPWLILLDLRLPRVDGFEVLEQIRGCARLRTIPVVVFSGSDDEVDVRRAYELGANSYITKPESMEGYRSVIRVLEAYWLRKVEMPLGD